jgi:fucose permease
VTKEVKMTKTSYQSTFRACCTGFVAQAAVVNLTPILFIPLRTQFGFTFTQLGMLVMFNFLTQLTVTLICCVVVDRIGFRFFAVAGHILAVLGFTLFGLVPFLPIDPFIGFVIATIIFSLGGGLFEVILNPIVNALPTKEKSAAISLLHAFYCWGQMGVVILTTLFLFVFGITSWPFVMFLWVLLPLINGIAFLRCPIVPGIEAKRRSSVISVIRNPIFFFLVLLIIFAGASELTISQWTSAYAEDILGVPKVVGDILGMSLFAVMMGVARTLDGIKGKSAYLSRLMFAGGALATVCYIVAATTTSPVIGLGALALCGLGVSLLWPGTISLSVKAFPLAGTWMMALLAAGGSSGASVGPMLAGVIADHSSLRTSFLVLSVFPLGVVICLTMIHILGRKQEKTQEKKRE